MVTDSPEDVPPSTPAQATFSSDGAEKGEGTPPSSPPCFPWEQNHRSTDAAMANPDAPSNVPPVKNAFSMLGKRKASEATAHNARPAKLRKSAQADDGQMQMRLGQRVQKKCTGCGMEYTASSAEDRKLHDKYHQQNTQGYDVGKDFVAKTTHYRKKHGLFNGVRAGDSVVLLDCMDPAFRRKRGQAVLDMVQRELGAVPIPGPDMWECESAGCEPTGGTKYKAYLYVRGTKCVGFLLVQSIREAHRVVRPAGVHRSRAHTTPAGPDPHPSSGKGSLAQASSGKGSLAALKARKERDAAAEKAVADEIKEAAQHPLQHSPTPRPAVMGISRIWTSSTVRGHGIATCLIETAIKRHNIMSADPERTTADLRAGKIASGLDQKTRAAMANLPGHVEKIEHKEQVAFSQPTDAGARLARKWYGRAYGWSVYLAS